jgi:hypothetical protein
MEALPNRSYSQLSAFEQCKLQHYYDKVLKLPKTENVWAFLGSAMHLILERYDKGECTDPLTEWQAVTFGTYKNGAGDYNEKQTFDKLHYKIAVFFTGFKGFHTPALFTEQKLEAVIHNEFNFVCFIDRQSLDTKGNLIVVDYKISTAFDKKKAEEKFRQLRLYAYMINLTRGDKPSKLVFFFPKESGSRQYLIEPYNQSKVDEAVQWARDVNKQILATDLTSEEVVEATPNYFYCKNLCSFYNNCKMYPKL